jgi:uncharacterized membrane protein
VDDDEGPHGEAVRAGVVALVAGLTGVAAASAGEPGLVVAHYSVLAGIATLAVLVGVPRWRRAARRDKRAASSVRPDRFGSGS